MGTRRFINEREVILSHALETQRLITPSRITYEDVIFALSSGGIRSREATDWDNKLKCTDGIYKAAAKL